MAIDEADLRTLRLTQEAVLRLIDEVAERIAAKEGEHDLITVEEAARLFRISRWRFYHVYRKIGLNPVRRIGKKVLFRRADVRRVLAESQPRRGRPPNRLKFAVPDGA